MTEPEETLAARFAAVDKAIALLGHLYTAHLVVKALNRLGHLSIVAPETDATLAGLVVMGSEQREMVFYVGSDGWNSPDLVLADSDGTINDLPATASPDTVAEKIVAHITGPDPRPGRREQRQGTP